MRGLKVELVRAKEKSENPLKTTYEKLYFP